MAETTTIARPYAEAVFAAAKEADALQAWSDQLNLLANVVADEEMAALIDSPRISREQLLNLLFDICGDGLNDKGKNLVNVLAENYRLHYLPEIAALYEIERASAEGRVTAEVVSASPLSDAQQNAIAESLKKRLGREVSLECSVDESLVGGAVIRAGDLVIDGSVASKLERMGSRLLH